MCLWERQQVLTVCHRERAFSTTTLLPPPGSFKAAFPSAAAKMKKTIQQLKKGKPASSSVPCQHTTPHRHLDTWNPA